MGFFDWLFGDNDASRNNSQTANGNGNYQKIDNSRHVHMGGGGFGTPCGGPPSLQKCDGAFGPGCKYQWNCPAYSQYLKNISD